MAPKDGLGGVSGISRCCTNSTCLCGVSERLQKRVPNTAVEAFVSYGRVAALLQGAHSFNGLNTSSPCMTGAFQSRSKFPGEHCRVCRCSGLRSTSSMDFTLPRPRTKFDDRAFPSPGLAAWNALPIAEDLRAVADPAQFRKER